jgi:hypothetical protein
MTEGQRTRWVLGIAHAAIEAAGSGATRGAIRAALAGHGCSPERVDALLDSLLRTGVVERCGGEAYRAMLH